MRGGLRQQARGFLRAGADEHQMKTVAVRAARHRAPGRLDVREGLGRAVKAEHRQHDAIVGDACLGAKRVREGTRTKGMFEPTGT